MRVRLGKLNVASDRVHGGMPTRRVNSAERLHSPSRAGTAMASHTFGGLLGPLSLIADIDNSIRIGFHYARLPAGCLRLPVDSQQHVPAKLDRESAHDD